MHASGPSIDLRSFANTFPIFLHQFIIRFIISLLFFVLSLQVFSQKKTFVRVYDEDARKLAKGYLIAVTDSSLTLLSPRGAKEIVVTDIKYLKLRKTHGHTIAKSALIVGGTGLVLGALSAEGDYGFLSYSAAEGAAAGFLLGAAVGSVVGFFVGATRVRPRYEINHSLERWLRVKLNFEGMLVDRPTD